mgnify:CR=1 FL=1
MSCRRCAPSQLCPPCAALLARAEGTPVAQVTEAQLLARVREVARRLGMLFYHTKDSRGSDPGWVDVAMMYPADHPLTGVLWLLELKRTGEVPTLKQRQWLEALGTVTRVESGIVWPEDLEELVQRLMRC